MEASSPLSRQWCVSISTELLGNNILPRESQLISTSSSQSISEDQHERRSRLSSQALWRTRRIDGKSPKKPCHKYRIRLNVSSAKIGLSPVSSFALSSLWFSLLFLARLAKYLAASLQFLVWHEGQRQCSCRMVVRKASTALSQDTIGLAASHASKGSASPQSPGTYQGPNWGNNMIQ